MLLNPKWQCLEIGLADPWRVGALATQTQLHLLGLSPFAERAYETIYKWNDPLSPFSFKAICIDGKI